MRIGFLFGSSFIYESAFLTDISAHHIQRENPYNHNLFHAHEKRLPNGSNSLVHSIHLQQNFQNELNLLGCCCVGIVQEILFLSYYHLSLFHYTILPPQSKYFQNRILCGAGTPSPTAKNGTEDSVPVIVNLPNLLPSPSNWRPCWDLKESVWDPAHRKRAVWHPVLPRTYCSL